MNVAMLEKLTAHYDKYFCQKNNIVMHPKETDSYHIVTI